MKVNISVDDLKRCPKCGYGPSIRVAFSKTFQEFWIQCDSTNCDFEESSEESLAEAKKLWNGPHTQFERITGNRCPFCGKATAVNLDEFESHCPACQVTWKKPVVETPKK